MNNPFSLDDLAKALAGAMAPSSKPEFTIEEVAARHPEIPDAEREAALGRMYAELAAFYTRGSKGSTHPEGMDTPAGIVRRHFGDRPFYLIFGFVNGAAWSARGASLLPGGAADELGEFARNASFAAVHNQLRKEREAAKAAEPAPVEA